MMPQFTFKREVSFGEMLTFLSVSISVVSVIISWSIDRRIRLQENIRIEIAKTMNKINQVTQLQLLYYDLLEEDFEDVAYMVIIDKKKNTVGRDFLWKQMFIRRTELTQKVMEQNWEIAYVNLLPYNINIDSLYKDTIRKLTVLEAKVFYMMLEDLENTVLYSTERKETAFLTRELRQAKNFHNSNYKQHVEQAIQPLNDYLTSLFNASDNELLFSKSIRPGMVMEDN